MFIQVLKSKIGHARVTGAEPRYEGSITIDTVLIKAAGLIPGEKVHVLNEDNGSRLETYVIAGKPGSGEVCLNGPAALHGRVGDQVMILSYALAAAGEAKKVVPSIIYLDSDNKIEKRK